ncbi:hypothetical protein [Microcoleus sp. Pol17_C1]|uniref:hypothetical protein n=1 Tax=unclassified Microcoleus TaxID=2642155 RepID=UPI002FD20D12
MNSLLLISPDRALGFKPILSGNSNANDGKIAAARVNQSRWPSRHLILNKGVLYPPPICLAATLQQYSKRQPFAST